MPLTTSTAKKLREAILNLLTGQSFEINKNTGEFIPNNETTDPLRINPVDNISSTHTDEFSTAKHLTSKQKTVDYETKGMKQTVKVEKDEVTKLPKYIIKVDNQPDRDLQSGSPDGEVQNQELDVQQSKVPLPHDFSNDQYMASIVNSIIVSVANSVAEAVTDIIIAKIENNQTEIEIEWDPTQNHKVQTVNLSGMVTPGQTGAVQSGLGTISFKSGFKYKHKCKIKFSNL